MPTTGQEQKRELDYVNSEVKRLITESVSASPGRMSEIAVELTSLKAWFSEKLDNILVFKADRLEQLKEGTSVAAAKVAWNSSPEGKEEIVLRGVIGRIKDQVSVIKSRLQVKRDEQFGAY